MSNEGIQNGEAEPLSLRVDLKSEIAGILNEIIDERKLQTYAEAIRYCIVETYRDDNFKLHDGYYNKIRHFLKYDFVQNEERVHGVQDFVNKALDQYFHKIDSNSPSILSFDVRRNLNEKELSIALAFIELQEDNIAEQVTGQTLAEHMGKRNVSDIKNTLNEFVKRGILDRLVQNGESFYHAQRISDY